VLADGSAAALFAFRTNALVFANPRTVALFAMVFVFAVHTVVLAAFCYIIIVVVRPFDRHV
jgi:hypothetical protein